MNNEPQQLHPGDIPHFQINKLVPFDDVKDMAAIPDLEQPGFTQRQLAAIELRAPDSGLDWLDKMIEQSRHYEAALCAMRGMLGNPEAPGSVATIVTNSHLLAREIIATEKGGAE